MAEKLGTIFALSAKWLTWLKMRRLLSRSRSDCSVLLGLALGLLLTGNTLAHPLAADANAIPLEAGRDDLHDTASLASERAPGVSSDHLGAQTGRLTIVDGRSPTAWLAEVPPLTDADPTAGGLWEPRPPDARQRPMRPGKPSPDPTSPVVQPLQTDAGAGLEPEVEGLRAIREQIRSVVEAAAQALDVRKENNGQVRFSLAGVDGLYYVASGDEAAFGYGDTTLTVAPQGASSGASASRRGPQPLSAQPPEPSESAIIKFILEILQYPLVWMTILLLVSAKIALLIVSRRGSRRSHRRRSRTGQHAQQGKVERTRKRVRVRFRIKRRPASGGLQEP